MQNSTGKCVTLMTVLFSHTKVLNGMQYRRGIRSHAKILLGAIYENSASFFTIDMVLIANKYLEHD
jgi:hypothetical protein